MFTFLNNRVACDFNLRTYVVPFLTPNSNIFFDDIFN